MPEHFYCTSCHRLLIRAHLAGEQPYCPQCLNHDWQNDIFEALALIEAPLMEENVEILNEALILP
ncbi:MAG: hypothetical protein AB1489_05565 [Acidobacteriota bacterium]